MTNAVESSPKSSKSKKGAVVFPIKTGRRKTATARAILKPGTGKITVNGRELENYFPRGTDRLIACLPLVVTGTETKFDITVTTKGGGVTGQAGAISLGIARSLDELDESYRPMLRANKPSLLTRNAKEVERKKVGLVGARKAKQFSKR